MKEVLLGQIENDGKTCSWPTPGRKAETIKILTDLQQPIPQELLDKIKSSSLMNIKSPSLYQWGLETTLSLECVDKDLNVLMIAEDKNTKECLHICHSADNNDDIKHRIDTLIKMVAGVAQGNRTEDNEEVANEIFTIIANVCAAYCAESKETFESFMRVINHYVNIKEGNISK